MVNLSGKRTFIGRHSGEHLALSRITQGETSIDMTSALTDLIHVERHSQVQRTERRSSSVYAIPLACLRTVLF